MKSQTARRILGECQSRSQSSAYHIEQLANRFAIVRNENKWSVHRFQQTNGERNVGLQPARWLKPEHIEHRHDETDHPEDEAADVARFFVTLAHVTNSTRPRMK